MPLTEAQRADFAVYARRPATWLEGSRRHLAFYEVLSRQFDRLNIQTGRSQDEFSGCFYAAYLHAGLAVENAVTAFLVAEDPTIIEDGRIIQPGHDLQIIGSGNLIQTLQAASLIDKYNIWTFPVV